MCVYMNVLFVFLTEKTWIKSDDKTFLRDKVTFSIFVTMFLSEVLYYADDAAFLCVKPEDGFWKTLTKEKHQP